MELTPEDREDIQQQIVQYQEQQLTEDSSKISVPTTPDGRQINKEFEDVIKAQATPDKHEERRIKKKIKGIWHHWRTTALDAKALEVEQIACKITIERAKTQAEVERIRRANEIEEAQHWLTLNKGNLEEIDANTESRPSKFWYGLRRGFHHITKLTNNIPRIFKNLFWVGVSIIGLILLKHFNVL